MNEKYVDIQSDLVYESLRKIGMTVVDFIKITGVKKDSFYRHMSAKKKTSEKYKKMIYSLLKKPRPALNPLSGEDRRCDGYILEDAQITEEEVENNFT